MIRRYESKHKNLLFTVKTIKKIGRRQSQFTERTESLKSVKTDRNTKLGVSNLSIKPNEERTYVCFVCQKKFVSSDEVVCCEAKDRHVFHLNCLCERAKDLVKIVN